jgi:Family of unknown function (DUF6882)
MQERNDAWIRDYGLQGCHYDWSLDTAQLVFRRSSDEVVADICVIGSVSEAEGTFLWACSTKPLHIRPGEVWREFALCRGLTCCAVWRWVLKVRSAGSIR